MKRSALIFALPILLGAASAASAQTGPQVSVSNPWIRYLLPSVPAGGYLTLHNNGTSPAVLTGASSSACGTLMLHKSENKSGTEIMVKVDSITVPAHGEVSFSEGGYHLMCMKPNMKLGEHIPVTLKFQDGTALLLTMPVYGPSGPSGQ
ncbi:copper chaperone PCu(A)C [Acidocella sp.]|uniref:copper chaperone PCu(A)C n=1 Tax=Acidocella sp. TaxID=50710 RepID=UPI003CFE87AD